jgi:hypothetical protein
MAECLAAHTHALDKIVARSATGRPYEFAFGVGPLFCDGEPVQ